MTSFMQRLYNSLVSLIPWKQNPLKRNIGEVVDEDNEGIARTPIKRQRLQPALPLSAKVNQPVVTTVWSKPKYTSPPTLKITEVLSPMNPSSPGTKEFQNVGAYSSSSESARPPNHVASPSKLKKGRTLVLAAKTRTTINNDWGRSVSKRRPSPQVEQIDLTERGSNAGPVFKVDLTKADCRCGKRLNKSDEFIDLTKESPKVIQGRRLSKSSSGPVYNPRGGVGMSLRQRQSSPKEHLVKRGGVIDLTSPDRERGRRTLGMSSRSESLKDSLVSGSLLERDSYGVLLGTVLENSRLGPSQSVNTSCSQPVEMVDLTRKEEEEIPELEELCCQREPVSVVKVTPSTSTAGNSSGEKSHRPRTNSFETKIKHNNYAQEFWLQKLLEEYKETQRTFKEARDQLMKEATEWNEVNRRAVEELLLSKLDRHLRLTEAILEEVPEEPVFPELTPEMEKKIDGALLGRTSNEVLIQKFGLSIKRADILTLKGLSWLNDEIINFYMQLIEERSKNNDQLAKVHTFNTFFYANIQSRGYQSVRRWTRKVDVFGFEMLLIPIHLSMHWCMAVVDFRKKRITYLDSMGRDNDECLKHLANYLKEEHQDKKSAPYDLTGWLYVNAKEIPQQMNGSDCGVFACTFAEYSSRDAKFTFDQKRMPYFRRKMIYEIITGELMKFR